MAELIQLFALSHGVLFVGWKLFSRQKPQRQMLFALTTSLTALWESRLYLDSLCILNQIKCSPGQFPLLLACTLIHIDIVHFSIFLRQFFRSGRKGPFSYLHNGSLWWPCQPLLWRSCGNGLVGASQVLRRLQRAGIALVI